jgi:hypothetical protein
MAADAAALSTEKDILAQPCQFAASNPAMRPPAWPAGTTFPDCYSTWKDSTTRSQPDFISSAPDGVYWQFRKY